ncbi:putative 2OG-Fe(II) oxygenase family oxidoreductase [Xylariomycetidae sp. FL0641]|nr:putative 2OG-Fe(II) oxygenase family oxidoreductase [Xylariomycetidae sp. FL0641]
MATVTGSAAGRTAPLIPVVDIGPFLRDPQSPAAGHVVDLVRQACRTTGFFQIVGHGVSQALQADLLAASRRFFALDRAEKQRLDARATVGRRGYDALESQSYPSGDDEHDDRPRDRKEGFFLGPDLPPDDPAVRARRFFMGPNVWPDDAVLPRAAFRDPVEAYFDAVHALALRVLGLLEHTLPYGPGIFAAFTAGHTVAALRLLHYPPAPAASSSSTTGADDDDDDDDPKQLGAGAHTDFGAITLLLQDDAAGLEVRDPRTGAFVAVDPSPDALVFNVGDMLAHWTGGAYRSSVHRVINKAPRDRFSAAFFYDGALDCPLRPFGQEDQTGGDHDDNSLTVEKHMLRRIGQSYGTAQQAGAQASG